MPSRELVSAVFGEGLVSGTLGFIVEWPQHFAECVHLRVAT